MTLTNPAPGFESKPDHRLTYTDYPGTIRVEHGGHLIASSGNALVAEEGDLPAVYYVPRGDVNWDYFFRTDRSTYCPYKGDASYWTLKIDGTVEENVAWSYETPFDEAAVIKDHIAFYGDRLEISLSP